MKLLWSLIQLITIFYMLNEFEKVIFKFNLLKWLDFENKFISKIKIIIRVNEVLLKAFKFLFVIF